MSDRRRWFGAYATGIAMALSSFSLLGLFGCGEEAPPYDELPLRDALRAAPEVVASLSPSARRELGERLDAAGLEQEGAGTFALPEAATIDELARIADDAREEQGQDALIVGELVAHQADFELHSAPGARIDERILAGRGPGIALLRGHASRETASMEERALAGRAGRWLREVSGRVKTETMVRTTGLPFGAWAYKHTLYVNASWLVAMSALEAEGEGAPMGGGDAVGVVAEPPKAPLSVDYNPYNLPDSIAECAAQVTQTCQCGTSCTHEVTDPSFADGNAECAWVNQDSTHPAALCVLAMMSVDAVLDCMKWAGTRCLAGPVTTREDAVAFVQSPGCVDTLDQCLRDGYLPRQSVSSDCNTCSGCNGCDNSSSSNDSCSKCNDDCSKCNDNCSQCNQNCSDCNQNCKDSNQNAKTCGKCSVRRSSAHAPDPGLFPAPIGTTFWMLAPIAYVLRRNRRRS